MSNTRLASIETRQRKTRVRDLFFAFCVVAAAAVSITSVSTSAGVAHTHVAQR